MNKKLIALTFLLISLWFCHFYELHLLAERDKHFSLLSEVERELSFHSEMAMYYSYFKILIGAPGFPLSLTKVLSDNCTQFPDTINSIKRFNIYPEVLTALLYKIFLLVTGFFGIPQVFCGEVDRGTLPSISSCEGLGDPTYFYVNFVFVINGFLPVFIFLFGYFLSDNSVLGGLLSAGSFFFNHRECTRVMWTPPLRESFAFPFFVLQNLLIEIWLRQNDRHICFKRAPFYALVFANVILLTCWQFSQFVFFTQLVILSFLYGAEYFRSNLEPLLGIIFSHGISLFLAALLSMGNRLLLTSLFTASVIGFTFMLIGHAHTKNLPRPLGLFVRCSVMIASTFSVRRLLTSLVGVEDDSHILDLLKTKFTAFRSFHTQLYVCAPAFDFIGFDIVYSLSATLLLPCVALILVHFLLSEMSRRLYLLYHFLQLGAYTVMAILIMRLKLFFTPFMCVTVSLMVPWIFNKESCRIHETKVDKFKLVRKGFFVLVLSGMLFSGYKNIRTEFEASYEFSNWPMESLISYIQSNTKPNDAFAGVMPTVAAIRLSASRPIVNNPYYEDSLMRNRTFDVYTVYSRKPLPEIYQIIKNLSVSYIVIDDIWCESKRDGCALAELYDITDVKNRNQEPACFRMIDGKAEPFFKLVFRKEPYTLLKVLQ